jgi:ribose 1,5-bisphosphokinase
MTLCCKKLNNTMSNLFYVIGPSGAGKDTLINHARATINGKNPVAFAHRYITREHGAGNENHIYLSAEEFILRRDAGFFALHWESHGNYYGIGAEINKWMECGFNVVVNGSRAYLPAAQALYPEMVVILITASAEIIAGRLAGRGRESAAEVEKRIRRSAEIDTDLSGCIQIQNDTSIETAGEGLVNLITPGNDIIILK